MDAEEPQGARADHDPANQSGNETTPPAREIEQSMQAIGEHEPAEAKTAKTEQPTPRFFERPWRGFLGWWTHPHRERPKWTDVSTVFLFLAVTFLGVMQWLEMRGTSEQTDNLVAAAQAIASHQRRLVIDNSQVLADNRVALDKALKENRDEIEKALTENRKALGASVTQGQAALENSEDAFRIDQRPYVVTTVPVFTPEPPSPGKPIAANIGYKNLGKTPAIKVVMNLVMNPFRARSTTDHAPYIRFLKDTFAKLRMDNARGRREFAAKGAPATGRDVAPITPNANADFSTNQNVVVISAEDFPLLQNGQIALMDTGVITYTDAFGGQYVTEFCYQYFGADPKTWHICDTNNSIR